MESKYLVSACSVSNIHFTVHTKDQPKKVNKITFKHKKNQSQEQNNPQSAIRKYIETFIPITYCNPKKNITVNAKTNKKIIEPLKGLEISYKKFPIRKTMTSSCINFARKQKNFNMGPQKNICFSNKLINQSIWQSTRSESKLSQRGKVTRTSYSAKRRSLPCNFQSPLIQL